MKRKVSITLDEEIIDFYEKERGIIPFSTFINERLKIDKKRLEK